MSKHRPDRITVTWTDPWDNTTLCVNSWPYNIRRAADGWYSREIARLREGYRYLFSDVLGGRTPKTVTRLS